MTPLRSAWPLKDVRLTTRGPRTEAPHTGAGVASRTDGGRAFPGTPRGLRRAGAAARRACASARWHVRISARSVRPAGEAGGDLGPEPARRPPAARPPGRHRPRRASALRSEARARAERWPLTPACLQDWTSTRTGAASVLQCPSRWRRPSRRERKANKSNSASYQRILLRVLLSHAPPDRAHRLPRRYLENTVVPTLTQGLTQMCIQEPEDPICWLAQVCCGLCHLPIQ